MPAETAPQHSDGDSELIRLHISPLDPDLLKLVLPAAVAAKARNISFHTIETFPEKRYGYVELPTMEAEKLKKKFNGSVLKGNKLRVEKARPEQRLEPTAEADKEDEEKEKKKKKKKSKEGADLVDGSKKRKRDPDVVQGVALTDRKVKRGWTEPADQRRKKSKKDKESEKDGSTTEKKKRQRSKYTDKEECLLKTKLPLNAVGNLTEGNLPKKRKKRGNAREITVHEFEKTTKFPSFLKSTSSESQSNPATDFVEGKGWVDEDGNIIEVAKTKPAPKPTIPKSKKSKPIIEKVVEAEDDSDDDTSSSGTSSSGTSSDGDTDEESESESESEKEKTSAKTPTRSKEPTSDGKTLGQTQHATPISAIKPDGTRPVSPSSTKSLSIKIPPPITPSAGKIHPLEALYKRPKPDDNTTETPAPQSQPFSFFGGADMEDEDEGGDAGPTAPMTPFTRQDMEWRNQRSAAPTPDTAHPTRMRNFWAEEGDVDADMDNVEEEEDDTAEPAPQGQSSTSEFQTWFWENRRDLNRSWMTRRKTAAKEKRHRENKTRASKAV
ncbi:hypothetical protein BGZ63DRAFT_378669 [Mariannaea sp. PMI_226]|nr:hypothetical protein BGZ63DRAFT_378669 [Mariannaea sp. PMI_226]